MKKVLLGLALLGVAGGMMGCEQDPLRSYPQNVQEGRPIEDKPRDDRPKQCKDCVITLTEPENIIFYEGQSNNFRILLRVTDIKAKLVMIPLELPDGAKFDPATGNVTWTPMKGTIKNGEQYQMFPVKVRVVTEDKPVIVFDERTFMVHVYTKFEQPVIQSVNGAPTPYFKEGRSYTLQIAVRDPNNAVKAPVLVITSPTSSGINAAAYATVASSPSYSISTGLWTFFVTVDLYGEVTANSERFDLIFQVVGGASGLLSSPYTKSGQIVTKVKAPTVVTNKYSYTINEDDPLSFSVMVYAPNDDGYVNASLNCNSLSPAPSTCSCRQMNSNSQFICQMDWKAPQVTAGSYTDFKVTLEAETRNNYDPTERETVSKTFDIRVMKKTTP